MLAARRRTIGPFIRFVSSSRINSVQESSSKHEALAEAVEADQTLAASSLRHPLDAVHRMDAAHTTAELSGTSAAVVATKVDETKSVTVSTSSCTFITLEHAQEVSSTLTGTKDVLLGTDSTVQKQYPQVTKCAFTGLQTKYKDPRTGIKYGNAFAYRMIQELESGEVPWNPQLKMYVPRCTM